MHTNYKMRILMLLTILAATTVAAVAQGPTKASVTPSEGQKAYDKLKMLSGSWQGTFAGKSVEVTVSLTALGSALMHDMTGQLKPGNHEITMIYVEGDRLLMTHYCDAGNRQSFEGKLLPDGKTVEFNLLDVTGGKEKGFIKRLAFTMIDENHHSIDGDYILPNGKSLQGVGAIDFQRTK